MGVTITVEARQFEDLPAPGADIWFTNTSAKFKDAKNWRGTADPHGICTWNNMDKGTFGLGDIYEFHASYIDPKNGKAYTGEKTERIKMNQKVLINLREAHLGETFQLKISSDDLAVVSALPEGDEIISVIKELSVTTKNKLSHASVMLESYIVESFIRTRLRQNGGWKDSFEKLPLGALLDQEEVENLLGESFYRRVKIMNELRKAAVHPKEVGTYFEEAIIGIGLMQDLIKTWFSTT